MLGYLLKKHDFFHRFFKNTRLLYASITSLYLLWIGFGAYIFGPDRIAINVATNQWKILFITIPAICFGCASLVLAGQRIGPFCKWINYIGSHSLIYFAFASHGMSIGNKLFQLLATVSGSTLFQNRWIINPCICLFASAIMIVPCLFIDRFIPFLNGRFRLPKFTFAISPRN